MDGLLMKYFVLRPAGEDWHAIASREAMRVYAHYVQGANGALSKDVTRWVNREEKKFEQTKAARLPKAGRTR